METRSIHADARTLADCRRETGAFSVCVFRVPSESEKHIGAHAAKKAFLPEGKVHAVGMTDEVLKTLSVAFGASFLKEKALTPNS